MDERAARFRRVIEPLHDRVLAFARCLCRSNAEGDDLFQEAMLRAFTRLDALRDDGAVRTWLYRIVITVQRSRSRRAFWRRLLPLGERAVEEVDYRTISWTPEAIEANRRVRAALARLPSDQREAIVLFEIEGWLVEEIAALHDVSESAIKSRLARGRVRLRALYDAEPALTTTPTIATGDTP